MISWFLSLIFRVLILSVVLFALDTVTIRELPNIADQITVTGGLSAYAIVALVFGFFHTFLRPILELFAFPIRAITLGLFSLVINGFLVWLVPQVLQILDIGVLLTVDSLWVYVVIGFCLAFVSSFMSWFR